MIRLVRRRHFQYYRSLRESYRKQSIKYKETREKFMEKRYQIFISSTYKDLEKERKAIIDLIAEMKCFPTGMENFPAYDIEQLEYIKKEIDACDYYVLILAHNYGSLAEDGVGYTEKEYDYAVSQGIPVLAFVQKESCSNSTQKSTEELEKQYKLELFRKKVMSNRLVKIWSDLGDLKCKVQGSLEHAFRDSPRMGWIKYTPDLERIKDRKAVNEFIRDAKEEVIITGNGLNSLYDSASVIHTMMKNGVTIKLILLSQKNLKQNCSKLGAGYSKMKDMIKNTLIRLKTYQKEYLGKQLFVKTVSTPIWTNIIAKDIGSDCGIIGANHLLYDIAPADCLYVEFDCNDKFYSAYKSHVDHLWEIGEDVDFTAIPTEFD